MMFNLKVDTLFVDSGEDNFMIALTSRLIMKTDAHATCNL